MLERGDGWAACRSTSSLPWPLYPREFVYLFAVQRDKGGAAYTMQRSIPGGHSNAPEQPKKFVRGKMLLAGFLAVPSVGGERRTKVIYTCQLDPSGNLPLSVVDMFIDDMAHTLGRMQHEIQDTRLSTTGE